MGEKPVRLRAFVTGKVQGVYYRDSTVKKGEYLGVVGAVWNLADGRVELVAEGGRPSLEELEKWCWKGPEGAAEVGIDNKLSRRRKVSNVEVRWEEAHGDLGDEFRNGGKKS